MRGRKYILQLPCLEKSIWWELFEAQLFKIADEIERVCSVPVTIKMKNYNSSASELIIRYGKLLETWSNSK